MTMSAYRFGSRGLGGIPKKKATNPARKSQHLREKCQPPQRPNQLTY